MALDWICIHWNDSSTKHDITLSQVMDALYLCDKNMKWLILSSTRSSVQMNCCGWVNSWVSIFVGLTMSSSVARRVDVVMSLMRSPCTLVVVAADRRRCSIHHDEIAIASGVASLVGQHCSRSQYTGAAAANRYVLLAHSLSTAYRRGAMLAACSGPT